MHALKAFHCASVMLLVSLPAAATPNPWVELQVVSTKTSSPLRVKLLENQAQALNTEETVGNSNTQPNPRPRKIVIEAASSGKPSKQRVWELAIPSKTIEGDPCSVVGVSDLSVDGQIVTVELDYQFACGAGSSIVVTHKLRAAGDALTIDSITLIDISRDGERSTQVDFRKGEIVYAFDAPELVAPKAPVRRHFKPHAAPFDTRMLLRCPSPLQGHEMPACRSGPLKR
ncbi:hypothetical protein [Chitinolyticbacter meiyuanensis]|uniref:hypothetical protein n=1 Tax=Chitinolyticbacter meiyuanensis TaxID=682798 RepID=UPI0011E5ABC2|nr:hypothetical protein [Chitinolyticbacter meiyuanensis]